jgi:hypothetical protein
MAGIEEEAIANIISRSPVRFRSRRRPIGWPTSAPTSGSIGRDVADALLADAPADPAARNDLPSARTTRSPLICGTLLTLP